MKNAIHSLFCLSLVILMANCTKANKTEQIDRLFEAYQGKVPGASLAIIQNGEFLYKKGFGMANLEEERPVISTTNFRLASVTKQFTATAILQLQERSLIDLKWNLGDIFDDFPDYGKAIKVHHLLRHTSGLPDYEDYVPDSALHVQVMDQDVLEIIRQTHEPYFPAGEKYRYSNTAYAFLALIVEKYSGMDFPAFLKENIFLPVGMKNTVAHIKNINTVPERAFGYDWLEEKWIQRDQSATSAVLGDGGIYSNVEDLFLWDQVLYTDKILAKKWMDMSFSYGKLHDGSTIDYGFGWHLKKTPDGEQVVYHTGSSTSFRNIFYRIPSKNLSVIILTNRRDPQEKAMVDFAERVLGVLD